MTLLRTHGRLSVNTSLLLLLCGILTAAESPAPDKNKDDSRHLLENTQYWYGNVTMVIRGSGHRVVPGEKYDEHYTLDHQATLKFRLSPMAGELTMLSMRDEVLKNMSKNPVVSSQFDKMRSLRHWLSPLTNSKPEDEADVILSVKDRDDSTGEGAREGGGKMESAYWFKTGSDTRKAMLMNQLTIDFAKGTYELKLDPKSDLLNITDGRGGSEATETSTTTQRRAINTDLHFANQPLPKAGGVISGSKRIPNADIRGTAGSVGFGTVSGRITWTLSAKPLEDVELVLKPDGYDDWLPRGGKDEQTEGNTIKVNAVLQKRGGGSTNAKMKHITVGLSEVSTEPGVCLNVPLNKGAQTPDLNFTAAHNPGVTINDKGLSFYKDGSFTQLPIVVSCYDWGAWGNVVAQAELDDGRMVWATLDGDPATEGCRLPKRDEDSKIASKWKEEMGVSGQADSIDRDRQNGNNHDGDGLTAYEEYRGLIAKGKHTRDYPAGSDGVKPLTPTHKDLIVRNTVKNSADIQAGFTLFQKASGIHIVELSDGELPDSRQVNINAGQITAGPQFGLVIYDAPSAGNSGATSEAHRGRFEPKPSTPKGFEKVTVDLAGVRADVSSLIARMKAQKRPVPFTVQDALSQTIAHELAHGVGVEHHGLDGYGSAYKQVTEKMTAWKVFDVVGAAITDRPFDIVGAQGNPGCESSGNVDCIMCYDNIYAWCYNDREQTFYAVPMIPFGKTFCTDAKGTGINASQKLPNGRSASGFFGDAIRGNCLSQMKVKDQ